MAGHVNRRTHCWRKLLTVVGASSLWAGILHAEEPKNILPTPPTRPAGLVEATLHFDPFMVPVQDVAPVVPAVPGDRPAQSGLGLSPEIQQALSAPGRSNVTGSLAGSGASAERVAAASGAGSTGVIGGSQAQVLASTDAGDLLTRGGTGIEGQRRSPVATEARIRGYKLGQIATWADGAFWFPARNDLDTFLSKIDSGIIRDAIVIKGPYSSRYGPGLAFIDIETYETPRYQDGVEWHGRSTVTYKGNGEQFYGRQSAFGGGSNWGARLSYGHRTGNDYTMGNGETLPTSYNVRDIDFAFGFDPSPNQKLEIGYIRLDQTGLEFPGQVFDTNWLVTDGFRGRYIVTEQAYFDRWETNAWYNRTKFAGDAQHSGKRQQIPELDASGFTGFTDADVTSSGVQTAFTWGRQNETQWTIGTDFRYLSQELNEFDSLFQIPCDLNYPIPRTEMTNIAGIFFENRTPFSERFLFKMGGRIDFMASDVRKVPFGFEPLEEGHDCPGTHFAGVKEALGVDSLDREYTLWLSYATGEYKLNENITLLGGVGFSMRPPTPTELYAIGPFLASLQQGFTSVLGNPDISPEKLYQVDMGMRSNFERFRGGVNLFHAWVNDYVTFEAIGDVQGKIALATQNALQVRFINTSLATLYGGEAYAEYDVTEYLTPYSTIAYVRATDQSRGNRGNPELGLPNPESEPLPNIVPLDVRLGIRFHERGQQPRYSLDISARLVEAQNRVAASLLEQPTAGFTVWDLRGYWQVKENVLLTAGVENLFDKFYREHLDLRTGLGVFQPGRNAYVGMELRY